MTDLIPKLGGVIVKDDLFKKGKHDYAPWARIAHYINNSANGWQFQVKSWSNPEGQPQHVWKAPNGTAYLTTCFTGPGGDTTPDFVYALTDFNNKPLKYESVDARAFTDGTRRALCANAAMAFALGYELWAKEEVAEARKEEDTQPPKLVVLKETPTDTHPQEVTPKKEEDILSDKDRRDLLNLIEEWKDTEPLVFKRFLNEFRAKFGLTAKDKVNEHINEVVHQKFCNQFFSTAQAS